ncbi:MAG: hypothetical protein AAF317_14870 [Pseudomonadota bacterium]
MTTLAKSGPNGTRLAQQKQRDYRIMLTVGFPLFVIAAFVMRFGAERSLDERNLSLFGEARALANTVIPFAFMH